MAHTRSGTPVVQSMGMGVDSVAILLRWIHEPDSRDFDLADLVVLTAMVGHEFDATGQLMDTYVLPLMRAHGIRYVQVARGGPREADGIVVLDDSRRPQRMVMTGPWRLGDELRATGTVPQVAAGRRLCSVKFKGFVLDTWLAREFGDRPYRHVMGFAAEEATRVERDRSYSTDTRLSEYPLLEWDWDREGCHAYFEQVTGQAWARSCCAWCPFQANAAGLPELLARYRAQPGAALEALALEYTAVALNPNSVLFGSRSVREVLTAAGRDDLVADFDAALDAQAWALYDVRRILHARRGDPTAKGPAWRSVRQLATGSRDEVAVLLAAAAAAEGVEVTSVRGVDRVVLIERGQTYPCPERFLAAAPAGVADKERAAFASKWAGLVDTPQLILF